MATSSLSSCSSVRACLHAVFSQSTEETSGQREEIHLQRQRQEEEPVQPVTSRKRTEPSSTRSKWPGKKADKGQATVIQDAESSKLEAIRQLSDPNYYVKQTTSLTTTHAERVETAITDMVFSGEISTEIANGLRINNPRTARFYLLPKIHKQSIGPLTPGRPIISGNGSPTEHLSSFIDEHIKIHLPLIKSYVRDTTDFINKLENFGPVPPHAILVTMDVTSLYTNIPHNEGLRAVAQFLRQHGCPGTLYNSQEMLKGKLELLKDTNMIDYIIDIKRSLGVDEKDIDKIQERRVEVVGQLKQLEMEMEPIIDVLQVPEVVKQLQSSRDSRQLLEYLQKNHNINPDMINSVYTFAKFQYECGNYSGAAEYLMVVEALLQPNDKNYLNTLWGKLASEILMQNWEVALEDLNRLKEVIDSITFASSLQSLQQRTWLLHWSLFVFFNHAKGRDSIIDMFLYQTQYLNAIQTLCPHLLRYLTTAVITSKQRRRMVLKDLVKVIQQESYTYRDPITEFVECLYVNFDFAGAQQKLRECEIVLVNDFFLVACLDEFRENARLLIFETFCRIHECISIDMLAEKLNMSPDEAEKWIVNLIRNARLDAKIDSKLGHVVMGTQAVSPYQQVIEKTKNLAFRSQMLSMNIEKKLGIRSTTDTSVPQWGAQE